MVVIVIKEEWLSCLNSHIWKFAYTCLGCVTLHQQKSQLSSD